MPRGRPPDEGQEIYEALSSEVRRARLASGRTQTQVAATVGTDQQTYSDYERGRTRIPLHLVNRIEEALDLAHGELLIRIRVVAPEHVPVTTATAAAIETDPSLDDVGRQVVIHVYEYCRKATTDNNDQESDIRSWRFTSWPHLTSYRIPGLADLMPDMTDEVERTLVGLPEFTDKQKAAGIQAYRQMRETGT